MTLLEQTYQTLRDVGLVRSAADFSDTYLSRNRNWYSWQRHACRDISVTAAIQCLRAVRAQLHDNNLGVGQRSALEATALALQGHLLQHAIADVC